MPMPLVAPVTRTTLPRMIASLFASMLRGRAYTRGQDSDEKRALENGGQRKRPDTARLRRRLARPGGVRVALVRAIELRVCLSGNELASLSQLDHSGRTVRGLRSARGKASVTGGDTRGGGGFGHDRRQLHDRRTRSEF